MTSVEFRPQLFVVGLRVSLINKICQGQCGKPQFQLSYSESMSLISDPEFFNLHPFSKMFLYIDITPVDCLTAQIPTFNDFTDRRERRQQNNSRMGLQIMEKYLPILKEWRENNNHRNRRRKRKIS